MGKNEYQGLIFTNHLLERMRQRGITHNQIWETFKHPDKQDENRKGATERTKKFEKYEITILFKHTPQNEVIIITCWMDPPLPGSQDARDKAWWENYRRAGFFGKAWLSFLKQTGLY